MFSVASACKKSNNNVRRHITKYKTNKMQFMHGMSRLVQVDTNTYRKLHKMVDNNPAKLTVSIMNYGVTHIIDIDRLMVHMPDCEMVDEIDRPLEAYITNINTTDLDICDCCNE